MDNTQIQIQFPSPGEWDKFTMIAVFPDADRCTYTASYIQDDIPADQAPALAAAVTAIANMKRRLAGIPGVGAFDDSYHLRRG